MFKILSSILIFLFTSKVLADCKPVTPIKTGEVAPCPGFIFSPEKELQLRQMNEDYKLTKQQIKIYLIQKENYRKELEVTDTIIRKEEQKTRLWQLKAEDSTAKLVKIQEQQNYRDWIFMSFGVALTLGTGYVINKTSEQGK